MNMKKNGYLLIITLFIMAALIFFAIFYVDFFRGEKKLAQYAEYNNVAAEAAKAGIDNAIYTLKRSSGWNTGFNNVALPDSKASYSVTFDSSQTLIPYSTNNSAGTTSVAGYGGRAVPAGMIDLISVGNYNGARQIDHALIVFGLNPFSLALFVDKTINMNGTIIVDSFDSTIGPYNESRQNSGGNMATNSGADNAVKLIGAVSIYGNVSVGPGGAQDTTIKQTGGAFYQNFELMTEKILLPFYDAPVGINLGPVSPVSDITLPPGTYSSLTANSNHMITLQDGIYVFTEDINIGGGAGIIIPQNTKIIIYALKNINLSGNSILNQTNDPKNFTIFGGPDTLSVQLSGSPGGSLGIYAPAAALSLSGNSALFGSFIGKNADVGGTNGIHFDRSMKNLIFRRGNDITIKSRWTQLK